MDEDYEEAFRWVSKAADQGNLDGVVYLATCYLNGIGVTEDRVEAVRLVRTAAERGHVTAQYNLGRAYFLGVGVPANVNEAIKWWHKAFERGDLGARQCLIDLGVLKKTTKKHNKWRKRLRFFRR